MLPLAQLRVIRTNTVNGLWVSEGGNNLAEGSTIGRGQTVNLCLQGAFCVTLHLSPQNVVTAAAKEGRGGVKVSVLSFLSGLCTQDKREEKRGDEHT